MSKNIIFFNILILFLSHCSVKSEMFLNNLKNMPSLMTVINKWFDDSYSIDIHHNGDIHVQSTLLQFDSSYSSSKAYYQLIQTNNTQFIGIIINDKAIYIIEASPSNSHHINWSDPRILFAK